MPVGYKLTEVGVIPVDWEVDKIISIASITTGAKNTQDRVDDGEYPFFVRSQTVERINSYSFDGEAVLTAGDGVGTGKVFHYVNEKFDFHQRVYKISNFNTEIDGFFFFLYFSQFFYARIMSMTAKSSVDSVRREMIANMLLPIPPILEQKAIAIVLSDTDALITSLDKLIAKKRDIKQAAMQQLLTGKQRLEGFGDSSGKFKQTEIGLIPEDWDAYTIGDLVNFSGGSQPPRSTFVFNYREGYIRLIQIRDYKTNEFLTYIPEGLARKKCSVNDVMIGRYGPPIFQILKGIEGAYNVALIKSIPSEQVDLNYWYYYVQQDSLFYIIEALSQRSSGQTGIDMPSLKGFKFPLPPFEEQQAIAKVLSDMDSEISALEQRRDKTKSLKQAMMQELLTGRIRLR